MPGTESEFLPPGFYLIHPAIITVSVSETLYVTAPEITGERLTLEKKKSKYERQIVRRLKFLAFVLQLLRTLADLLLQWRVKAVDEGCGYRTIERGDWSHTGYPPTFGLKSPPDDRTPVYCLDGEAENPHKWGIYLYNVGSKLFKQPNFAYVQFFSPFNITTFTNDVSPVSYLSKTRNIL